MTGHIQRFCPKERNWISDHRAKAAEEIFSDSGSDNGIFVAGGDLSQMGKWSGASSHMFGLYDEHNITVGLSDELSNIRYAGKSWTW